MLLTLRRWVTFLTISLLLIPAGRTQDRLVTVERSFEATFESKKAYSDPFNDVDVDVIFSRDGQSWRVPTFWRGGNRWTVRFAPPSPGLYEYRLESTDPSNLDLNRRTGHVRITSYTGSNALLRHGGFRVSANKHYLEYADGTPFFWLGDDWYNGFSSRLSWEDFKELTADRKAKGFTVAELAFLTILNEEPNPTFPGFCNEGGCIWDRHFNRINPRYFDYTDRRVQFLIDSGIAPALFGDWHQALAQMGVVKMKKQWRYIIARYGANPVFWVLGGEINDPPRNAQTVKDWPIQPNLIPGGWTEVARYIRATDPYHHLLTVHEGITAFPIQDPSLIDFDLVQPGHVGWPSLGMEVAEVTARYARDLKPVVVGEVGYENFQGHLEDFQRIAFWLAMLNGAAGYSYGTIETASSYTSEMPFEQSITSLFSWEEAMNYPGSRLIGLNSKLLRHYPWYDFAPHPEWIVPRGSTLLDSGIELPDPGLDLMGPLVDALRRGGPMPAEADLPGGEWRKRHGTFHYPYAAGIPRTIRIVYVPYFDYMSAVPPTVLNLEAGVQYHSYLWDPSLGVKVDLGAVARPEPGKLLFPQDGLHDKPSAWVTENMGPRSSRVKDISLADLVASADVDAAIGGSLLLRYRDPRHYVAATYSPSEHAVFLRVREGDIERSRLGNVEVPTLNGQVHLAAEVRGAYGIVSVSDAQHSYSSPIVLLADLFAGEPSGATHKGSVGVLHPDSAKSPFSRFEVRASPVLVTDHHLERKLYDARGVYRGELGGTPEWDTFGRRKLILLDAYRPEAFPYARDWVLILERTGMR